MPIYAYRCTACGFEKDVLQKVSAPLLTQCPECNSESFVKKLTAPGFQLKGTGWYVTDFKGGGSKPSASDDKPDTSKGDGAKAESSASDTSKPSGDATPAAAPASGGATSAATGTTTASGSAGGPATA